MEDEENPGPVDEESASRLVEVYILTDPKVVLRVLYITKGVTEALNKQCNSTPHALVGTLRLLAQFDACDLVEEHKNEDPAKEEEGEGTDIVEHLLDELDQLRELGVDSQEVH